MKITAVDPIVLRIPFQDGGTGLGMTPQRWAVLDTVLVRVETDTGLVGWGKPSAISVSAPSRPPSPTSWRLPSLAVIQAILRH
jgi:L-alanine-DL-glutamate epimerase-like enolase superfamily enzyme